jgi:hypothetical protein
MSRRADMQPTDLQGHVKGLMTDWCAENGFGSDSTTVSTFTELANKLLDTLAGGMPSDDTLASFGTGLRLSDEETVRESATDQLVDDSLFFSFAEGESDRADTLLGVAASNQDVKPPTGGQKDYQSPPPKFFLDASGDWRVVMHDDYWWAVGHHLVYPARDRDHAEKRCQELSHKFRNAA